jgi:hypothetical protein
MKNLHKFIRFLKYCKLDLKVKSNTRTVELTDSQFISQSYYRLK